MRASPIGRRRDMPRNAVELAHRLAREAAVGQMQCENLRALSLRAADRRGAGDDFVIGMGRQNEDAPTEHAANRSQAPRATH